MTDLVAVGVDGAAGGWVAVAWWGARSEVMLWPDVGALLRWRDRQAGGRDAPVAIDMPIGLPERTGLRACDRAARAALPARRRSSIFPSIARSLLVPATAPAADGTPATVLDVFERVRERAAAGEALSRQAAGLVLKVAELDLVARACPDAAEMLVEAHPELCFLAMAAAREARTPAGGSAAAATGDGIAPKTTAAGMLQRLALVEDAFGHPRGWVHDPGDATRYGLADVLDAYAACWTAIRWRATGSGDPGRRARVDPPLAVHGETAPGTPDRERATGLPRRIVT